MQFVMITVSVAVTEINDACYKCVCVCINSITVEKWLL